MDLFQRHAEFRGGADVEEVGGRTGIHGHEGGDARQQVRLLIQPGTFERVQGHLDERLEYAASASARAATPSAPVSFWVMVTSPSLA
ncbi:hypothetical protein [Streptomyces albogriseolus]|uniref:hypothetical protein n=1 Tax=Streptomyces albogriseolus TaxID=1887 RepID=UPI0033BC6917